MKMDPIKVLTVMGLATKRLGLGSTASTTYFNPCDVARNFATLDLMAHGRRPGTWRRPSMMARPQIWS